MKDYPQLGVRQIHEGLRDGDFSARELASAAFDLIDELDPKVHAFLELTPELAYEQADAVDKAIAAREPIGILAGVPIAFKDNMNLEGTHTTCASHMLETYVSPFTATCVAKALDARGAARELASGLHQEYYFIRSLYTKDTGAGYLGAFWFMVCEYIGECRRSIRITPIVV